MSDIECSLKDTGLAVFERGACGGLTGWSPVLCLLGYLIVLSTIYRVGMYLGLGHAASDLNMSMKDLNIRVLVLGMIQVNCCGY